MPVEIRELVVRIEAKSQDATTTTASTNQPPHPAPTPPIDEQALVEACVEAVLRILREREAR